VTVEEKKICKFYLIVQDLIIYFIELFIYSQIGLIVIIKIILLVPFLKKKILNVFLFVKFSCHVKECNGAL